MDAAKIGTFKSTDTVNVAGILREKNVLENLNHGYLRLHEDIPISFIPTNYGFNHAI
jgi:hypothetical protein